MVEKNEGKGEKKKKARKGHLVGLEHVVGVEPSEEADRGRLGVAAHGHHGRQRAHLQRLDQTRRLIWQNTRNTHEETQNRSRTLTLEFMTWEKKDGRKKKRRRKQNVLWGLCF